MTTPEILTTALARLIGQTLARAQGWIGFDRFMALALYAPGLGYYANASRKFGRMPATGSDFVTAPELTPLFGQTLAVQVAEALQKTGTDEVWEFGAGSGALALQLLEALDAMGVPVTRYRIVDLSGTLRARQQETLARYMGQAGQAGKVEWLDALPDTMQGVVVGNEVLDAMPVQLLARVDGEWFERGVIARTQGDEAKSEREAEGANEKSGKAKADHDKAADTRLQAGARWAWQDRATDRRPPIDIEGEHDYLTEIHPQAEAFIATLADRLTRGAAFFIDYGFPESEYYHPQRHMGTVMCHRAHQADGDPLADVGLKDITAHVNFSGIALAAQNAGLSVMGYCSQARFLLNCGLMAKSDQAMVAQRALVGHLVHEHEMGELFKVIGLSVGDAWEAVGFAEGDRTHTL